MIKYYIMIMFFLQDIIFATKSLKILFVSDKFPYQMRQYIDNQIAGFIDAGMDVNIFAEEPSDYTNYSIAKKYNFEAITFYKTLPQNKKSFDIIYCQFSNLAFKMLEKRNNHEISGIIICCFRAGDEFRLLEQNIDQYKFLFAYIDLILVVCEAYKKRLIDYGCPAEKIMVHHSAINLDDFPYHERIFPINQPIKILTIGRLHPMKGHRYLIEAINKIKNIYPSIQYNIYGVGRCYKELYEQIKLHNLENIVFLKGYCDHDLVADILHEHHIFILGSYTMPSGSQEGIPNVLMEAMATGMPVIGTKHSGIPELIEDGQNGFIVEEKNSEAIGKKIMYLIKNPHFWKKFGKNGRKKVIQEHNKIKQNKKLIDLFMKMNKDSIK